MIADAAGIPRAGESANERRGDLAEAVAIDECNTSLPCCCCGGRMAIIERFARGVAPQFTAAWNDTS
jgi:hypothetical protein